MGPRAKRLAFPVAIASALFAVVARGDAPAGGRAPLTANGPALVRLLGNRAGEALAPTTGQIGALVSIPPGKTAASLGLDPVTPQIGRIRASRQKLLDFADAHPDLRMEVAPPLRLMMDKAGEVTWATYSRRNFKVDGTGVIVGVADTGLDVTHADFIDEKTGLSRVAWMLDLSLKPIGSYPELEKEFGIKDDKGNVIAGAVLARADIDDLIQAKKRTPGDEVGHGTHVAGIAAGNGGGSTFVGIAPKATLLIARVTRGASDAIDNDDLVQGVKFLFNRAELLKKPMVVNVSLGTDFGPHDGSLLWEEALASYVGPDHPGRALVVAAGNNGSAVEAPIHQSVYVTEGTRMRVAVQSPATQSAGGVQIWVRTRPGSSLKVGLDGPDGEWIPPQAEGEQRGKNTGTYNAGVIHGSTVKDSPIPEGSRGAVVIWTGGFPAGGYAVTFEGEGTADLYLQALGEAGPGADDPAHFAAGVREGTIDLPADHPNIIAVGCTVSRPKWKPFAGTSEIGLKLPILDDRGGYSTGGQRDLQDGEICWFSAAGPTVTGVPKPEIAAPGAAITAAMSAQAKPGVTGSIFTNPGCPATTKGGDPDPKCLQIDATHGVSVGTSMSSPMVAGAVALLFQRDPTLTQDRIVSLLQGGAHSFRRPTDLGQTIYDPAPFSDQSGPGELDVNGALDALDQTRSPREQLPARAQSWLTMSASYVAADGSTPITAILELRTEDGRHRADLFDANRLQPVIRLNGTKIEPPAFVRRAPGLWFLEFKAQPGWGGASLAFGATFDGEDIVEPKVVPVATDIWTANYPASTKGGCAVAATGGEPARAAWALVALGAFALRRRITRRRA